MPPIGQVHIDRALTNFSLMYRNESFIADKVLPILPVDKRSNKYFIYNKAAFLSASALDANSRPASLRRPGAEAAEIDFPLSTDNYYAEEYAYRDLIPDAVMAYADDPLQPDMDATILLTERLLLDNELLVAKKTMTSASYATANKVLLTTGGSGTSWAQYASANSLPFSNIVNAKVAVMAGIVREPNSFVGNMNTCRTLADHPLLKELVKYTHQDALTVSGLPKVMRGLDVFEAPQQYNTAAEGASFSGGSMWVNAASQDTALIYYRSLAPSPRSVSYGYTFEAPDDATKARGISIRRWREEKRKGNMIEAAFLRDFKICAVDGSNNFIGGYLISGTTL